MTSVEEHQKNIKQFLDDINEKIRAGLLLDRQKIIAFSASEAAANLLEYYLHKKQLVQAGFRVNHRYFTSERKAESYFSFPFSKKQEIIKLLIKQEEYRDILCYGKEKEIKKVQEAIDNLTKLKQLIIEELGEEI
ncbi:hypothetical protein HZA99_02250 [Candidatus Woesearchaeota archaeon]|nr:hypothetical protein [Candidatus Woesearchaeota archaeon]